MTADPASSGIWMGRPTWAEIDLDAIAHNLGVLRRRAGPACRLVAVVKADAYGHGAVPIAQAALKAGAYALGVISVEEGAHLRRAGIEAPILVMGATPPRGAEWVAVHHLTATVTAEREARALAEAARSHSTVLPVHLKVDTGMHRQGASPQETVALAHLIAELGSLHLEGLYTHFAAADEGDATFTRQQLQALHQVAAQLPHPVLLHAANTAALLRYPEAALDMARPGIGLYGCYPDQRRPGGELRPAMSLKSRIARLHWLDPGETVSYGRTWSAPHRTRVALIPVGYADGLPRACSNRGAALVRGQRAPIVGRVCMDQCIVNVTEIPGVELDDEVVLIGRQGEEEIPVEEVAALADTINYEVLCGISPRVPRLYLQSGQVTSHTTLLDRELSLRTA